MFTTVSQYSSVFRYSSVVPVSMGNQAWINSVHTSVTLTCSNDVEMNPGPGQSDDKGQAASTRRKQSKLSTTEQGDMRRDDDQNPSLTDLMKEIKGVRGEVIKMTKQFAEDVGKIKEDVADLQDNVNFFSKQLEDTRKENKVKLENMEGQSRRNNVIINGLPDVKNENWGDCEDYVNALQIDRAHRLPRGRNDTSPIIVKFAFFKDRETMLRAARKEKPPGVYFKEDYTHAIRNVRAKLKTKLLQIRNSERTWKTFLVFDKLIIANDAGKQNANTFDAEKDEIIVLYRNFDDSAEGPTEEDSVDSDGERLGEDAENSDE